VLPTGKTERARSVPRDHNTVPPSIGIGRNKSVRQLEDKRHSEGVKRGDFPVKSNIEVRKIKMEFYHPLQKRSKNPSIVESDSTTNTWCSGSNPSERVKIGTKRVKTSYRRGARKTCKRRIKTQNKGGKEMSTHPLDVLSKKIK